MKTSLATLVSLGLALGLGAPSSAQDASPSTTEQKTNPKTADAQKAAQKAAAPTKAPWAGLEKKMASLTTEQLEAARRAYAHLAASCPVGSRMWGTMHVLQKLYTEASSELGTLASAEGTAPEFRAALEKQIAMISELAKTNGAAIHVMKHLARTETTKTDTANAEPTCNITVVTKLVADWSEGRKAMAGMSPETKSELQKSSRVLADLGLHVPEFVVDSLSKQNAILTKAMGSMSCPKSGFMAKNSAALESCSASKAACTRAVHRLAAAHKLIQAVPIHGKKAAAQHSSATNTEGPTTETKTSTN